MSLGIRANLFAGFGVVLALNLVIGYIGLRNTAELSSQFKTLYEDRMMSIVKLTAAQSGMYELQLGAASVNYTLSTPPQRAATVTQDQAWLKQIDESMRAFAATNLVLIGFAFSAYLTYRELHSIHAICDWCAASDPRSWSRPTRWTGKR